MEKAWDRWDQAAAWVAWNIGGRGVAWAVVKANSAVGDRINCFAIVGTFNGDDEARTWIRDLTSARIQSIMSVFNT